MYLNRTIDCCGIIELSSVEEELTKFSKNSLLEAVTDGSDEAYVGAYIFFSVTSKFLARGKALAKFIRACKWGSVKAIPKARNTNSGNILYMWVWTPNKLLHKECEAFLNRTREDENYVSEVW